ncbi:hypothetical protein CEJ42_05865 [Herbaspirillum robiniae]|uniref:Uncharacterized protein n=2 Tax=Herbaspirillum robiniae TaxID=2014887 RepID=A0A246WT20_9BURK|nr:hypothetical protein CEJ42_05865 [Herbaspirillum robiniae]
MKIESLDVPAITDGNSIDPLLYDPVVASQASILRLASILREACERLRGTIANKAGGSSASLHLKIIDLASYAVKLASKSDQDSAALRLVITESMLDRGDFTGATQEAPKMMGDASAAFKSAPDAKNALLYARALKANAAAWREKRARNSSTDIRVSIALLDQASDVLWDFTQYPGVSSVMADINVDAARMLNLLRTAAELKSAEDRLVAAICFQMHAENGQGNNFESWRSAVNAPALANCTMVRRNAI